MENTCSHGSTGLLAVGSFGTLKLDGGDGFAKIRNPFWGKLRRNDGPTLKFRKGKTKQAQTRLQPILPSTERHTEIRQRNGPLFPESLFLVPRCTGGCTFRFVRVLCSKTLSCFFRQPVLLIIKCFLRVKVCPPAASVPIRRRLRFEIVYNCH